MHKSAELSNVVHGIVLEVLVIRGYYTVVIISAFISRAWYRDDMKTCVSKIYFVHVHVFVQCEIYRISQEGAIASCRFMTIIK